MLPRFFVQTHIFSVSPSSFRVSSRYSNKHHRKHHRKDAVSKVPHYTFASSLLVGLFTGLQSKPTCSLSLVQHPSATSRRSEEAPTLRLTARSGALQAPVRPCHCRQLAATWHRASGESRCRTRTCVAFERGCADTDRRECVCVWWCPFNSPDTAETGAGMARVRAGGADTDGT